MVVLAFFVSCNLSYYKNSRNILEAKQFHFKFRIVDNKNNPIENAYVEVSIKDGGSYKAKTVFDTTLTTNEDGFYEKSIFINSYNAVLDYYIQKAGYCSKEGYLSGEGNQTKLNDISFITLSKDSSNIVDFKFKCLSLNRKVISNISIDYTAIINDSVIYSNSCISDSVGIATGILSLSCDEMKEKINLTVMSNSDDYYFLSERLTILSGIKKRLLSLNSFLRKIFLILSLLNPTIIRILKTILSGLLIYYN